MATIDPEDITSQGDWLTAIFGGARYMSVDLRDFPKTGFTLSFWCRTAQEGIALFLGDFADGNSTDTTLTSLAIHVNSGIQLRFANWAEVDGGPSQSLEENAAPFPNLLDGVEHYVARAFTQPAGSAEATVALYLDGKPLKALYLNGKPLLDPKGKSLDPFTFPLQNTQGAPIALSSSPLYIATRPPDDSQDNPISKSDAFPGHIMDLRIWSRVTDAEIAEDQWNTVFGDEPNLYLALPLDEASVDRSSEKAIDLSPAQRDAVTHIIEDDMTYLYYAASLAAFPVGSRTVEMWLRCGYDTGGDILVSYAEVSSSDHPNDGGVPWFVTLGDFRTNSITDGEWHHLAVVVDADANTDTFYVDGIQQYRSTRSASGQVTGQPFLIGAKQATDANDQLFAGLIKDFYLWSAVRNEDQIWDSAEGKRPIADATLVLNVLQSQDELSDADEPAPALSPKHFLTLTADQMASGGTPSSDADNPMIDDYTVVMLVKPRQAGALFARMAQQADGLHGFSIACTETGGVQVRECEGPHFRITRYDPGQAGVSVLDGYRHSVAYQCLDDVCTILVDGLPVPVSQQTSADNPLIIDVNSTGAVQIGGADPAEPNPASAHHFAGDIFMVAYWNRGLDREEMHKAAFDLMDGLYTALLGYWSFNRTLADQSYMGDNLTMRSPGWFYPTVRTVWTQSASSAYRFHQLEGIAHRKREGERNVNITHIINVPANAAMFYGGLTGRGRQLAPPAEVTLSITDPSGSRYTTEADTDTLFVKYGDGGIRAFVVKAPLPGNWKVEINARAQNDFIFQAQVLPAQGAVGDIQAALQPLFGVLDPAVQQRERVASSTVLGVLATTALTAVIAVAAVVGGVVASPIAIPLLILFGVARVAAQTFIHTMDHADRLNACGQAANLTLPPTSGSTPMQGSGLQVIDSLKFPKPTGGATRSLLPFEVPAGTSAFSFHVWFDPTKVSSTSEDKGLVLTAPNGSTIPDDREPFLYLASLAMKSTGLTRGYCAISVPINPTQASNLIGQWTARIQNLAGVDPTNFQVRLCLRTLPANAPTPSGYRVPVNFFYVGSQWYKTTYAKLFKDIPTFLNNTVFNQANIYLDCAPLRHLRDDPKAITSDLYSNATAALVQKYSVPNAINVYVVENMAISIKGEGDPGGFSAILGPQGFSSPYTCIFVKVGDSEQSDTLSNTIGLRIAHEIGHSLGLIHESSCLDNQGLATNPSTAAALSQCDLALKERSKDKSATKTSIEGNLMYTIYPGSRLNQKQVFVLQHAPLLTPLVAP